MKKSLFVLLMPFFLSSLQVDSTEIDFAISSTENYQLNFKTTEPHFSKLPSNPNLYKKIDTFLDKELTQKNGELSPNKPFVIESVSINNQNKLVFVVKDRGFILASPDVIYDDHIISKEIVNQKKWLKKGFKIYSSPLANQQKEQKTNLKSYQAVTLSKVVTTPIAEYAQIEGYGWILTTDLSDTDNRIEAVQELLYQKYQSQQYSIYVKQLSTNKESGINQDRQMYAASITKLPVLYAVQNKLNNGQFELTQGLQYIDKVNDFKGAYGPEGSGSLVKKADNKTYQIDNLIHRVTKESDNAATNVLAYYLTNQFDQKYNEEITEIVGQKWDMSNRMASSKMAGLMMEALYYQNGYVLESLQSTNFDNQRIARDISVPVAHKIGDAYDFRHDVALVYAEQPFILSIFTEHSTYDQISQIANEIYGILK
ncbi:serine hydrolase [Streptococcus cameli]